MFFAVVNKKNKFLVCKTKNGLIFGDKNRAAVLNSEHKDLWEKFYPSLEELIAAKEVALVPHPNWVFYQVNERGYAAYENLEDGERVIGELLFPDLDTPIKEEEWDGTYNVL